MGESRPCLSGPNTKALNNLERPVSYSGRFIWGSFLCQGHNAPTMSLLKTAISGTETSIFQIGRLTLEMRPRARACHPPSRLLRCLSQRSSERGDQLENQKKHTEKSGFTWQAICIFFGPPEPDPFPGNIPLNLRWK